MMSNCDQTPTDFIKETFEDLLSHKAVGEVLRDHLQKCQESRRKTNPEILKWKCKAEQEEWINNQLRLIIVNLRKEVCDLRKQIEE